MRYVKFFIILFFLLTAAGCASDSPKSVIEGVDFPEPAAPEPGKATIIGQVFSTTRNAPYADIAVRLAEVVRVDNPDATDDLYVLDQAFSPGAITDANGVFVIENTEAGEFVIVVGDVEFAYEVITNESGTPKVWDIQPDEITNAGIFEVDMPK
jgi:hypothetical protein